MRDYSIIPLEINEYTDLDDFDEYEAHEHNWPNELIRAALREIDRREYSIDNLELQPGDSPEYWSMD